MRLPARAILAVVATVGLGGCSAAGSGSTVTATGSTLTIYANTPSDASGVPAAGALSSDLLDAEKLAYAQKSAEITSVHLRFVPLSAAKLSSSARAAIEDTSAIAYIGEVVPGTSQATVGITGAQQLLQVSPTDTAQGLTDSKAPGLTDVPNKYLEAEKTYGRTFARVVPNTAAEARADVAALTALGVHTLYIASDGSDYAIALQASLKQAAGSASIATTLGPPDPGRFAASGAQALFDATSSSTAAKSLFTTVGAAHPATVLFAPSALADPDFAATLGQAGLKLYVSAPGFLAKSAPPAESQFVTAFESTYHHAPVAQAVFGYEAMAAVLDVLKEAGASATSRGIVVHDFFTIHNRNSALGTYSINANGDTSIAPFVIERLKGGRLVPFAQQQG